MELISVCTFTCFLINLALGQHCSRINNVECSGDGIGLKSSLQQVLLQLNSSLVVKDVLTSDFNGISKTTADVTMLSLLMDIGTIPASGHATRKDPSKYIKWLEIFKSIENPVMFVTDKYSVARRMLGIRKWRPTIVIVIEKYTTWSFGYLVPKYKEIFDDEAYPKHHPNTIYPEYACVNHAKYEFMQILSHWNYFRTDAAAWTDVGVYRDVVEDEDFRTFIIARLKGFDHSKVTLNYIRDPKPWEHDHRFIMKYSPSIFAGGFWLGNIDVLKNFTAEYIRHVEVLLDEGFANCDEQVMASMFVEGTQFNPDVEIQPFRADAYDNCDRWLCLGHRTREVGLV